MKNIFILFVLVSIFACNKNQKNNTQIVKLKDKNLNIENGILFYNKIPFSGVIIHFDSLTKTENTTHYFNGKKEGEALKKYTNGALAEQRYYKNGYKVAVHKAWWPNGQLKFEYHFNNKGEYHGAVNEWYKTGQAFKAFHFSNGQEKEGQKMWQQNGKIRANYVVVNNERFGLIGLKKCYSVNTNNEVLSRNK